MKRKFLVLGMALCVALAVVLAVSSIASAAITTLTAPTTLSGSETLSDVPVDIVDQVFGVHTTFHVVTELHWEQPADLGITFDSNLVRQGRSPDPSISYTRPGINSGSMVFTCALEDIVVDCPGLPTLDLGDIGLSAPGPCDLYAGGAPYTAHLEGPWIWLLDPGASYLPGPYFKLYLAADVTVTPEGIATDREATFAGEPDGTASLTLEETPITDSLAIPCCTVFAGDSLIYTLGPLSTTPGISVTAYLVFEAGNVEIVPPAPPIYTEIASPQFPLIDFTGDIAMTGDGATFDMGAVLPNNIPPVPNAGGPYSGDEGSPILFDGSGSSSICGSPTLRWDFSDGGVAFGTNPQHTFQGPGIYSGLLTATDCTGLTSITTFSINVANLPPVANAGPDMSTRWGVPVTLNGIAVNPGADQQPFLTYSWDFGDGTPSASGGASVTHVYSLPGIYTATFTACDPKNACGWDTTEIMVAKHNVMLGYTGPLSSLPSKTVTLSAILTDSTTGEPLAGRPVIFQLGTQGPFTAMTDSKGVASYNLKLSQKAASYSLTVTFTPTGMDDLKYLGKSSSVTFKIANSGRK